MIRVTTTSCASRLVTAAAREALRPLGLQQRGRSRLWLDDRGWWLGIVEFQPGRNEGSYLNAGVMWLWRASDHLAYDFGDRHGDFQRFVNATQFAGDARDLAKRAAEVVAENRTRFCSLQTTADLLCSQKPRPGYFWDTYHAAMATAMAGDGTSAQALFDRVLAEDAFAPWMIDAQQTASQLRDLAADTGEFRRWAADTVSTCRRQLKLSPSDVDFDEA
jgi:hypothetical protein